MSEFADGEELLEEIVETTEEHDVDFCSNGDTIDDSSGLPLGEEFIEEVEDLKPLLQIRQEDEDEEGQQLQHQHLLQQCKSNGVTSNGHHNNNNNNNTSTSSSSSRKRSHSSSSSNNNNVQQQGVSTVNGGSSSNNGGRSFSRNHMEQEKRMRREIANSNERRRMQSINAGFQSLRTLLPHHEGEKLSKAAILQQTAEYIYQLEQQKTQLLSQNLQLKRLVDQHEGAGDVVNSKKRKTNDNHGVVVSLPMHVSESVDEGLGSMSPEPLSVITLPAADSNNASHLTTVAAVAGVSSSSNDTNELKRQLECERAARAHLEKQLRLLQAQIFPERGYREEQQIIAYQPHEVIEHTNNVISAQEVVDDGITSLQVVSVVAVPSVGSTQTIETSSVVGDQDPTPPLSPSDQGACEIIVATTAASASNSDDGSNKDQQQQLMSAQDLLQQVESSRPNSPKILGFAFATSSATTASNNSDDQQQQISSNGSSSSSTPYSTTPLLGSSSSGTTTMTNLQEFKVSGGCTGQYITSSPTRPFSPNDAAGVVTQRIPSVLEAAMKAEPKVEVERLPSPSNSLDDGTPQARLYLAANTSRQNLETIVEAIRHLEGDHLFGDEPAQDRPLALTNKTISSPKHRLLRAEVSNFLQFSPQQQQQQQQQAQLQQQQQKQQDQKQTQQRPGVIVAKHS
ncbi:hypothetical protein TKK_0005652 [Trichogramma kaykai]